MHPYYSSSLSYCFMPPAANCNGIGSDSIFTNGGRPSAMVLMLIYRFVVKGCQAADQSISQNILSLIWGLIYKGCCKRMECTYSSFTANVWIYRKKLCGKWCTFLCILSPMLRWTQLFRHSNQQHLNKAHSANEKIQMKWTVHQTSSVVLSEPTIP